MLWVPYALLSAFFAALVAILAKIGLAGIDSNLATAIRTVVILLLTWAVVFFTLPLSAVKTLDMKNWTFLILSGLATGLSWLFYFKALQLGPVSRVAPVDKLSVAMVIVLSFLFLGEKITWNVGVGGLLIVLGSLFMLRG